MRKVKTPELLKYVEELYTLDGLGYRKVADEIWRNKNIKVTSQTIKKWVEELGLEPHEGKKFKEMGPTWYKKEYYKLKEINKKLENENMELKEALERLNYLELKIKDLEEAHEKDQKIINMVYQKLYKEYINGNIKDIREIAKEYSSIIL